MGLTYPRSVQDAVSDIAAFCDSPVSILRERAVNALGRIGRGNYILIEPFWEDLFRFASDEDPKIVVAYDDAKLEELMQDAGIIRNRQKLKAAITNAQAFLNVQKEFGTFDKYIWSFTNGQVIDHHLLDGKDMPAKDELSERISNLILIAGHVKEHARRLILSLGKSNIWMGAVISMCPASGMLRENVLELPVWFV